MKSLDSNEVKKFYEAASQTWPSDDNWYIYSRQQIETYLKKTFTNNKSYILNAGSGGNDYGLNLNFHHVDIAKNKIKQLDRFTEASIENLPFHNNTFDNVICVGSVINYTDALISISELTRVLRKGGKMVLEFENSYSYEYWGTQVYKSPAEIVMLRYFGKPHKQWVYSFKYINNILKAYNMKTINIHRFHIISSLLYKYNQNENKAAKYAKLDKFFRYMPAINNHASNIILECIKL